MRDKVAFITGASRGVGAAVARSFHEAGAELALASRSGDDLGLEGALGLECDVRDPASVRGRGGRGASSASGGSTWRWRTPAWAPTGPFLEMAPEDVEAMIDINLKGVIYTARSDARRT